MALPPSAATSTRSPSKPCARPSARWTEQTLKTPLRTLSQGVGERIRALYRSKDAKGRPCDVLYFFWVMQVPASHARNPSISSLPGSSPETPTRAASRKSKFSARRAATSFPGFTARRRRPAAPASTAFNPEHGPAKGPRRLPALRPQLHDPRRRRRDQGTARLPALRQARADARREPRNICPPRPKTRRHTRNVRHNSQEEPSDGTFSLPDARPGDTATTRGKP